MVTATRRECLAAEPLALLVGADDNYAMPLAVTLFSALEHLTPGRRANVYIMDGGISQANRERIEQVLKRPPLELRLEWIRPNQDSLHSLLPGQGTVNYISKATYLRLFAPDFISQSRVIYLDSDLIVQRNLDELWAVDLAHHAVAAVLESGTTTLGAENINLEWQAQHLDPTAPYFNAGVLLINLDVWRAESVSEKVFANIRAHRDVYRLLDQDGLNVVLYNNWLALDSCWNFQASREALALERLRADEVFVIHFSNSIKPWMKEAFGAERPYFAQFLRALKRSGWFSGSEYLRFRAHLSSVSAKMVAARVAQRVVSKVSRR